MWFRSAFLSLRITVWSLKIIRSVYPALRGCGVSLNPLNGPSLGVFFSILRGISFLSLLHLCLSRMPDLSSMLNVNSLDIYFCVSVLFTYALCVGHKAYGIFTLATFIPGTMLAVLTPLLHNLYVKSGVVHFLNKVSSYGDFFFGDAASAYTPSSQTVGLSLDKDIDPLTSTDFEDLLVFALDALELLWQDVNLLVEICGDNVFAFGLGTLLAGSVSLLSRKVFSVKRLKR